jgi:hypothetical protein
MHLLGWTLTLLACAAWVFVFLSLITFSATDWPSHAVYPWPATSNICGAVGAWVSYQLFYFAGTGAWAVLFFTAVFIGMKIAGQKLGDGWLRVIGLGMLVVTLGALTHLLAPASSPVDGLPEGNGGILGIAASAYLQSHFKFIGARGSSCWCRWRWDCC